MTAVMIFACEKNEFTASVNCCAAESEVFSVFENIEVRSLIRVDLAADSPDPGDEESIPPIPSAVTLPGVLVTPNRTTCPGARPFVGGAPVSIVMGIPVVAQLKVKSPVSAAELAGVFSLLSKTVVISLLYAGNAAANDIIVRP